MIADSGDAIRGYDTDTWGHHSTPGKLELGYPRENNLGDVVLFEVPQPPTRSGRHGGA
jgi:hypothetical protein